MTQFEQRVWYGEIADSAELARLGHATRPRMPQIMDLLNLSPDIQESLLFLPRVEQGRDPMTERELRPVVAQADWRRQRTNVVAHCRLEQGRIS